MITAKEIREVKFNHSLGGYKTNEVDEFLDRCADSFDELVKINDENGRKMKVLAETVMDYRNQEDSIRSALISAQRMSESVITDARKQAEDIRNAARAEAASMREKILAETAVELEELRRVRQEVADFKAKLLTIYREHLTLIGVLEGGTPSASASVPVAEAIAVPPQDNAVATTEPADEAEVPYDLPEFSAFTKNEN